METTRMTNKTDSRFASYAEELRDRYRELNPGKSDSGIELFHSVVNVIVDHADSTGRLRDCTAESLAEKAGVTVRHVGTVLKFAMECGLADRREVGDRTGAARLADRDAA
jgi:hypothetical protein